MPAENLKSLVSAITKGRTNIFSVNDTGISVLTDVNPSSSPPIVNWVNLERKPDGGDGGGGWCHNDAVAALGGAVYVAGGMGRRSWTLDRVNRYDPGTDSWSSVAPLSTPRSGLRLLADEGVLYAVGGTPHCSLSVSLNTVERFDPRVGRWSPSAPLGTGRSMFAAAAIGGRLYAAGGWRLFENPDAYLRGAESLDPRMERWTAVAPMSRARGSLLAVEHRGKMYVDGGEVTDGDDGVPCEVYDPAKDAWSIVRDGWSEVSGYVKVDGALYAISYGDVKVLDVVGSRWKRCGSLGFHGVERIVQTN